MRRWITLIEDAQPPRGQGWRGLFNDEFCEQVKNYIGRNLGDWVDDFANDDFDDDVQAVLMTIFANAESASGWIDCYRSELRPIDQIKASHYGSVGQFWSWDTRGAQVCHQDNAYAEHNSRDLEEVMFSGCVSAADVNWVATVAKNLILKGEREITVRPDAIVHIDMVITKNHGDMEVVLELPARSNGHEDDF